MSSLLEQIVRRRRASASRRLGPPGQIPGANGAGLPDRKGTTPAPHANVAAEKLSPPPSPASHEFAAFEANGSAAVTSPRELVLAPAGVDRVPVQTSLPNGSGPAGRPWRDPGEPIVWNPGALESPATLVPKPEGGPAAIAPPEPEPEPKPKPKPEAEPAAVIARPEPEPQPKPEAEPAAVIARPEPKPPEPEPEPVSAWLPEPRGPEPEPASAWLPGPPKPEPATAPAPAPASAWLPEPREPEPAPASAWLPEPHETELKPEPGPDQGAPVPETEPTLEPAAQTETVLDRGFVERGRIRRRARYLRSLREVQLRDIGGFVVELHRFGRERQDLVVAKVEGAYRTDTELRALERALGESSSIRQLREPGIGGACGTCGAVHGSEDRYCASCGEPLRTESYPRDEPAELGSGRT